MINKNFNHFLQSQCRIPSPSRDLITFKRCQLFRSEFCWGLLWGACGGLVGTCGGHVGEILLSLLNVSGLL